MGFRKQARTYSLNWGSDSPYPELSVRAKSLPVKELLLLVRTMDAVSSEGIAGSGDAMAQLFGLFAGALSEWNLENEDGTPVPATLEGVEGQDLDFVVAVIMEWMKALVGVSPPLPVTSDSGETSPAGSLRLADSSQSLAS